MSSVSAPSRRTSPPSVKPALVVVGLALTVILLGGVVAVIGGSSAHPSASSGPSSVVPGSSLRAQSAAPLLSRIESAGEPPAAIVRSLAVPKGSTYLAKANKADGNGPFDSEVRISVPAPETATATFFRQLLSEERWVLQSQTSPSSGSTELIAQKGAADGYDWNVGITMTSTRPVVAPALGGSGASPARTTVVLELQQVEDAS